MVRKGARPPGEREGEQTKVKGPTAPTTVSPNQPAPGYARWQGIKKGTQSGKQAGKD